MHRGVRDFVRWLEDHREGAGITLSAPAQAKDVQAIEHQLGTPLPADLRLVLGRFNGGVLPSGTLLAAATGPGTTMEAALKEVAAQKEGSFLDPEALLPFHRSEGSLLAFDRSAAPIADTWPIVDFDVESGEVRLVHRTFDGWCRVCVAEWSSSDYGEAFTVDKYLRTGLRHVEVEGDVSIAHVTVGHALRRAGQPQAALDSYLRGGRCVPQIPWADWEALKIAVLLDAHESVVEAGARISKRAPSHVWEARLTTPSRVAYVLARYARALEGEERAPFVRAVEHLIPQAQDDDDAAALAAISEALTAGKPDIPLPDPPQDPAMELSGELAEQWEAMRAAYKAGQLRDEDLVLDPRYDEVAASNPLGDILSIRRDF